MAANVATGRTRIVRYCGTDYTVSPGEVYGRKQLWVIQDERGTVLSSRCQTRSRAVYRIHEHAAQIAGTFPAKLSDGLTYDQLVGKLCR